MLDEFRGITLKWDRANARFPNELIVNASDENGRKIVVQILDNGQVTNLSGANVSLYWKTRGGQYEGLDGFTVLNASKGLFELYLTTEMLSHEGEVIGNLRLQDSKGVVVSSELTFDVQRGINTEAVQSQNSFSALTVALEQLVEYESRLQAVEDFKVRKITTITPEPNVDISRLGVHKAQGAVTISGQIHTSVPSNSREMTLFHLPAEAHPPNTVATAWAGTGRHQYGVAIVETDGRFRVTNDLPDDSEYVSISVTYYV